MSDPIKREQDPLNIQRVGDQNENAEHHPPSSQSYSSRSNSSRSPSHHQNEEQLDEHLQDGRQQLGKQNDQGIKKQGMQSMLERKIRYKYCCKICKHTDKSKKACVCVVPKSQRRTQIGDKGCQTCGCSGCSKEDFLSRGQDPQYKPGQKIKKRREKEREKEGGQFQARNGCCRKCMKAFSKSNKSCLCQVPQDVRNTKLPSSGCKICGCFGCNPQDKKDPRNRKAVKKQKERERDRSRSRDKKKRNVRSRSSSSRSRQYIDPTSLNFYNVDKSVIGGMITNEYRLDPALLGFGVPQRTFSYIIGKPK